MASFSKAADCSNVPNETPYAVNLINAGGGDIRFIGVVGTLLVANLTTALTNAKALRDKFLSERNPVMVFLPYSYITDDTYPDLSEASYDGVGVVVSYQGDEIGLLLGRLADTQVMVHIGKVKDGAMLIDEAILDGNSDPQVLVEDDMTNVSALHDANYIVLGVHIGKAGYFFMGHPMATSGDFENIVNQRTIDKAYVIAYGIYLEELNNEVYVTSEGKLQPAFVKNLQESIKEAIDEQMANEFSGREAYFSDDQDVISTNNIEGSVSIQPVGHSEKITINLGLTETIE